MARAIVRYSFAAEEKRVRRRIREALRAGGFDHIGTGTFECADVDLAFAVGILKRVLEEVAEARLDGLWIYLDEPREVAA